VYKLISNHRLEGKYYSRDLDFYRFKVLCSLQFVFKIFKFQTITVHRIVSHLTSPPTYLQTQL